MPPDYRTDARLGRLPFMKLKRRDPALTCSSSMDASTTCFETLSYVDGEGMSSDPGGAVFDMYFIRGRRGGPVSAIAEAPGYRISGHSLKQREPF